jgi:hypothetical protein
MIVAPSMDNEPHTDAGAWDSELLRVHDSEGQALCLIKYEVLFDPLVE